jgi:hypothetical protein
MSDSPKALAGDLADIGTVAAANVVKALQLDEHHIPLVKHAIRDEINAMSSHFTLAFADIQTQYEAAVYQAKLEYQKAIGTFNFVKSNAFVVGVVSGSLISLGAVLERFVH